MNIYIFYEGQPNSYITAGFLENGFFFGQHICSHQCYMFDDLYGRREDRIEALKEIFGVDPNTVEVKIIEVKNQDDIPHFIQNAPEFENEHKRYKALVGPHKVEIKIEFTE